MRGSELNIRVGAPGSHELDTFPFSLFFYPFIASPRPPAQDDCEQIRKFSAFTNIPINLPLAAR